jgi:hypothetical protein
MGCHYSCISMGQIVSPLLCPYEVGTLEVAKRALLSRELYLFMGKNRFSAMV